MISNEEIAEKFAANGFAVSVIVRGQKYNDTFTFRCDKGHEWSRLLDTQRSCGWVCAACSRPDLYTIPVWFYVLSFKGQPSIIKIGVSKNPTLRAYDVELDAPYDIDRLATFCIGDGLRVDTLQFERWFKRVHSKDRTYPKHRFTNSSEFFNFAYDDVVAHVKEHGGILEGEYAKK